MYSWESMRDKSLSQAPCGFVASFHSFASFSVRLLKLPGYAGYSPVSYYIS